jgi:hypothetical protein
MPPSKRRGWGRRVRINRLAFYFFNKERRERERESRGRRERC